MDRLNPAGEPGRLTFITRMGAGTIRDALPALVEKVTAAGVARDLGVRPDARQHDHVGERVQDAPPDGRARRGRAASSRCTARSGTVPGGLHVELTGDDVTEVLGGSEEIDDAGLALRYETLVDPRLNHQQSLEMAFQVVQLMRGA